MAGVALGSLSLDVLGNSVDGLALQLKTVAQVEELGRVVLV